MPRPRCVWGVGAYRQQAPNYHPPISRGVEIELDERPSTEHRDEHPDPLPLSIDVVDSAGKKVMAQMSPAPR